jgi:hypothetical protein
MLLERDGGYVAIHPKFDKLITSLRTAVEKGEGMLDKEATSYDDIFDLLCVCFILDQKMKTIERVRMSILFSLVKEAVSFLCYSFIFIVIYTFNITQQILNLLLHAYI